MFSSIVAICIGASVGALLRWALSLKLNAWWSSLPLGTLAANLIGGYLVGVALAFFAQHPGLSPSWRLLVITGFLGGLTTFSTFSAEVTELLQSERWGPAMAAIALHVSGSLAMTWLGLASWRWLARN